MKCTIAVSRKTLMRAARSLTAATLAAVAISACSSDDNPMTSDTATLDQTSMPVPGSSPDDVLTLENLDGTWQQSCLATDSADAPYSATTLTIDLDLATFIETTYSDLACTSMLLSQTSERSLIFSGATTSTSLGEAMHVEMTNEETNSIQYDIMLIINDSLYIGDQSGGLDGSTSEQRPQQLDEVTFYTRSN